jgi:hypothetical protein
VSCWSIVRAPARSRERSCSGDAHLYAAETVTDIGDGAFHKGQPVWVMQEDGSQRAADYVGEGETSAWFGGPPTVIVVFLDTRTGAAVEFDRVIPRDV